MYSMCLPSLLPVCDHTVHSVSKENGVRLDSEKIFKQCYHRQTVLSALTLCTSVSVDQRSTSICNNDEEPWTKETLYIFFPLNFKCAVIWSLNT